MSTYLCKCLAALWLLILGVFCANAVVASTSGYDGEAQDQIEHDASCNNLAFGYDGRALLPISENDGHSVATPLLFGEFAELVAAEGISDSAFVVRGGQNLPQNFLNGSGVTVSESGLLDGVSVQSAHGVDLETLSQSIPHNQVGVTTVGDIRAAGGNVISSPTPYNPYHSILSGIDADTASGLFRPTIPNPAKP